MSQPNEETFATLTLRMTDKRHFQSMGNEVWILDICDEDGCSVVQWESMQPQFPWRIVDTDSKAGSKALITDRPAEICLDVPADGHLRLLKHPWSGIIEIEHAGTVKRIDLFAPEYDQQFYHLHDNVAQGDNLYCKQVDGGEQIVSKADTRDWIEQINAAQPAAVAIMHPHWRGVRKSAEELFHYRLYLEDHIDEASAPNIVEMLLESGCERVVLCGFPLTYRCLVEALSRLAPHVEIHVIWYASFLQSNEEFVWRGFKMIRELCQNGMIQKWGFAKKGMAETVALTNVTTSFVMHYMRQIPSAPSVPQSGGPHLGLWALAPIWRKSPYAMMAAAARIPNADLFVVGQNDRARRFGDILGLHATYLDKPIPSDEMPDVLAGMHLNLYVTLSECAPMLPLESLAAGAPCLMGPNSHYFEDHSYLYSRLVVPSPDRSDVIARYIERALEEREEILEAYIRYAPDYNRRAQQSLYDFLEIPTEAVI